MGNARVTYNKNIQIVDTNNYYPFGMNHLRDDAPSNFGQGSYKNYKYNGKELQEIEVRDSLIHLKSQKEKRQTGMYDYGARFYMADIGRWGVVDPLSEKYRRHSVYNYTVNNPIRYIDPDGRGVEYFDKKAEKAARALEKKLDKKIKKLKKK